ncbi:MAG: hypothetical protein IKM01_03100 [Clostridia bacterium]|nr:hypothetical protein [Clostridia bacterium]
MNEINQNLQELWGKVGFIVHLSQMVEYNLANILSADELIRGFDTDNSMRIVDYNELVQKSNEMYHKLSGIPLGGVLKQAKKVNFFNEDGLELLEKACKKRNYVVHNLFRDDLKPRHLETDPEFYFEELENTIEILHEINEVLTKIFERQKQEFELIY